MQKFTLEQVLDKSLDYFNNDDIATDVFINKYSLKDKNDNYYEPTPDWLHKRLAKDFARIEKKYKSSEKNWNRDWNLTYYHALKEFSTLVAQGSPMAAIGNPFQVLSASNCVVIESPEDSMAGIMKAGTELAQLFKRRAGVGVDISKLRPNGAAVNNAARKTTGPCSFADLYSYITRLVGQDGRRGALMITMDVHHPDIEEFALMKANLKKVTGANVSVRLSNDFMEAVENNTDYEQRWPCEGEAKIKRMVSAKKVWDTIVSSATKTAEPGLQFWDTMCEMLPAHCYPNFKSRTTNPCSEIILSANDACRLLSINLTGYVRRPFEEECYFDFGSFKNDVKLAMRMLDNLVDIELELTQKIMNHCDSKDERAIWYKLYCSGERGRRTGLGTHGLADALAQLRVKYDSEDAIEVCDEIYRTLRDEAYRASVELAKERGPFPDFDWQLEKNNKFIKRLPKDILKDMKKYGRRNISILTNAPTGSISILSKCGAFNTRNISSGIEPVYRLSYTRRKKINPGDDNTRVDFVDELGDKWQEYEVKHGNLQNYFNKTEEKEIPSFFVTSDQIDWKFRVKLQGVIQQYIDHSISSTINLPRGTSVEKVKEIYMSAWKNGLKGVTVYVDGSRSGVLVTGDDIVNVNKRPETIVRMMAPKRPDSLSCNIHHITVNGNKWIVVVGLLNGEPYEMFGGRNELISISKKYKTGKLVKSRGKYNLHLGDDDVVINNVVGTFNNPEYSWATRLVSVSLRHGTPIEFMVEQLSKEGKIHDFNKAMARVLKRYIPNGKVKSSVVCDSCNSTDLVWEEGCHTCASCGYAKCG